MVRRLNFSKPTKVKKIGSCRACCAVLWSIVENMCTTSARYNMCDRFLISSDRFSCVQHFDRHLFPRAESHGILFDDHVDDTAHPFCGLFVSPFEISCFDSFEPHRFPFLSLVNSSLCFSWSSCFSFLETILYFSCSEFPFSIFSRIAWCPCRSFLSSFLPEYRSS